MQRWLTRATIGALLVLLLPGSALADIAPPQQPLYGAPGPRKVRGPDGSRWRALPDFGSFAVDLGGNPVSPDEAEQDPPDEPDPDVEVVRREVLVDVYTTVARVRERTVLRSERPVRDLVVGFAQQSGRISGFQIYDLHARVDGRELDVVLHRGRGDDQGAGRGIGSLLRVISGLPQSWDWRVDVDGEIEMETSYLVLLFGAEWETSHEIVYDLRMARAWHDGAGPTTVIIRTHGSSVVSSTDPDGERAGRVSTLRPSEDAERVRIVVAFEETCLRRSLEDAEPWLALVDRVYAAIVCASITPMEAEALASELLAHARGTREPERSVARSLLSGLARRTKLASDPDVDDEDPEWLNGSSHADDPLSLVAPWRVDREGAARWLNPWSERGIEDDDDLLEGETSTGKRPFPRDPETGEYRPPPPVTSAAELTGLDHLTRHGNLGEPNAFVIAYRERRRAPTLTLALTLVLLLPFGIGYVRWRVR